MTDAQLKRRMFFIGVAALLFISLTVYIISILAQNRFKQRLGVPTTEQQTDMDDEQTVSKSSGTTLNGTLDRMSGEAAEANGSMGLSVKDNLTTGRSGQTITVFIYADSRGKEITGYDADINYKSTQFQVQSVRSLIADMDIYDTSRTIEGGIQELYITGSQSLSSKKSIVFHNTALIELTIKVLQSGPLKMSLIMEKGSQRESNLMDATSHDMLGSVTNL